MVEEIPAFDPGEPVREVALVLLEAAALPRRLTRSRAWPSPLGTHDWQVLLAIALGGAVEPEGAGQTPAGIGSALALGLTEVYEVLGSLRREGLASIPYRDPDAPEAEQQWSLTRKGVAAAVEVSSFAGRVLRWPPAPPASLT